MQKGHIEAKTIIDMRYAELTDQPSD
jgi:hypothetical protein